MISKKSLLGFLLPADTCHMLKFCKDPFRGVDKIGSKKTTFAKQKAYAITHLVQSNRDCSAR